MSSWFVLAQADAGDALGFGLGMGMVALIVGILAVVAWVIGLISAATNPGLTGAEKVIWLLVIFFLPVVGTIAYFLMRPGAPAGTGRL